MNKNHIDKFYDDVEKKAKYKIFALSLPMLLINKQLHDESERFYKESYDLLHSDIDVLAALYFNDEAHTLLPTQLCDAVIFSSGGMTKILKKLEDRGLIKRENCNKDKRKSFVTLTKNGVTLIESCIDILSIRFENHFKVLNQKEKDSLQKILRKILYSMI